MMIYLEEELCDFVLFVLDFDFFLWVVVKIDNLVVEVNSFGY